MRWIHFCLETEKRVLLVVIVLAGLSQSIVAMRHSPDDMSSPNAATWIGKSLAEKGIYEGGWWHRLRGPDADGDAGLPRMFHLPGEPLYTALGLKILPKGCWRFLHVPLTVLLIACAAWWGMKLGGTGMGLLTGLIGMFQPFVLLHGIVWDDTFLGAALDWLGAAMVLAILLRPRRPMSGIAWLGICLIAGYAAITRAASQMVFALLALVLLFFRSLRPGRPAGLAMVFGIAIALMIWGLRNRAVCGEFFLGSTHDGITLWESVYPSAIEALIKTGAEERMNNQTMLNDFAKTRHMSELAANQYFLHRAKAYLLTHPWKVLRAGLIKIADDLAGWSFDSPAFGARNLISLFSNAAMIFLALPALWGGKMWKESATPVRTWFVAVMLAQMATTFLLLFLGPSSLRYWMSVQPIFWMADAWTLMTFFNLYGSGLNFALPP